MIWGRDSKGAGSGRRREQDRGQAGARWEDEVGARAGEERNRSEQGDGEEGSCRKGAAWVEAGKDASDPLQTSSILPEVLIVTLTCRKFVKRAETQESK